MWHSATRNVYLGHTPGLAFARVYHAKEVHTNLVMEGQPVYHVHQVSLLQQRALPTSVTVSRGYVVHLVSILINQDNYAGFALKTNIKEVLGRTIVLIVREIPPRINPEQPTQARVRIANVVVRWVNSRGT